MAKNKKPLLQEGTVRRMMKLANMEALGDGFISEKWSGAKAGDEGAGKDKDDTDYSGKGMRKGDKSDTGRGEDSVNEQQEEELEVGAEEEIEGGEEEIGLELDAEEEAPADEGLEGEITITDEEAQDIIDLADKLKDAVDPEEAIEGGEEDFGAELDLGAEEEFGAEEFGEEEEELAEQEAPPHEVCAKKYPPGSLGHRNCMKKLQKERRPQNEQATLYEAALRGLNIDLVDDKARQRRSMIRKVKKRIYERVVNRLLREGKKK